VLAAAFAPEPDEPVFQVGDHFAGDETGRDQRKSPNSRAVAKHPGLAMRCLSDLFAIHLSQAVDELALRVHRGVFTP
jgi:hypothetical protein